MKKMFLCIILLMVTGLGCQSREVDSLCEQSITVPGSSVMTAFFKEPFTGQCPNYFVERGWRIVNMRRAHDSENHWGSEITFSK